MTLCQNISPRGDMHLDLFNANGHWAMGNLYNFEVEVVYIRQTKFDSQKLSINLSRRNIFCHLEAGVAS